MKQTIKKISHKMGLFIVCVSIVTLSTVSNIKKTDAIFFETWAATEIVAAICGVFGIGFGLSLTDSDVQDALLSIYDQWCEGAEKMGGDIATSFTNVFNNAMETGKIACDGLVDCYDVFYDWWCDLDLLGNQPTPTPPSNLSPLVPGLTALGLSNLYTAETYLYKYNKVFAPYYNFETNLFLEAYSVLDKDYCSFRTANIEHWLCINVLGNGLFELTTSSNVLPFRKDTWSYFDYSTAYSPDAYYNTRTVTASELYLHHDLENVKLWVMSDNFRFSSNFGNMTLENYVNGEWVLDPDWTNTLPPVIPEVKLLDGTKDVWTGDSPFVNDIDNIRVLGNDYTANLDGTVTGLGTLDVPHLLDYPKDLDWPTILEMLKGNITTKEKDKDLTIDKPLIDVIPGGPPTIGDINSIGKYALDWKDIFPFCIPFDLIDFVGVLDAPPKAPYWKWDYNFWGITGSIEIDLSDYDEIAELVRLLMDLCFIGGLIMITRDMIRG